MHTYTHTHTHDVNEAQFNVFSNTIFYLVVGVFHSSSSPWYVGQLASGQSGTHTMMCVCVYKCVCMCTYMYVYNFVW